MREDELLIFVDFAVSSNDIYSCRGCEGGLEQEEKEKAKGEELVPWESCSVM